MTRWSILILALVACSGGQPAQHGPETPHPEPEAPEAPKPDAMPDTPVLDAAALAKSAENTALVPSPVETERALVAAGVETQLASLIPKHTFDLEKSDVDHAAVRTGVVLGDMLLTVKTAEKDKLIERLESVRKGLGQLEGGSDIDKTLNDYVASIQADAISRDELLKEFDELSGAIIPELEFNGKERVVPLIQAGSWLEGANLVAQAVKAKGTPAAADGLLKQPAVVAYFSKYVKTEAEAPQQVTKTLEASLATLQGLAEKKEPLTAEDIDTVIKTTSDVLGLL
ncbi:MAG: hypothetical protein KC656_18245 [Myxococcales bacterium]|nr:hypothetical protein [Myxococcales bacterium]MCB9668457.1 hypothetical protein [Alphaproteobacteria bacterium]MCB9690695.1 hypothetical protein [Alphaproteobacteria bacterium]